MSQVPSPCRFWLANEGKVWHCSESQLKAVSTVIKIWGWVLKTVFYLGFIRKWADSNDWILDLTTFSKGMRVLTCKENWGLKMTALPHSKNQIEDNLVSLNLNSYLIIFDMSCLGTSLFPIYFLTHYPIHSIPILNYNKHLRKNVHQVSNPLFFFFLILADKQKQ